MEKGYLVYPVIEELNFRVFCGPPESLRNNLLAKVPGTQLMPINGEGRTYLYIKPAELNFVLNLSEKT